MNVADMYVTVCKQNACTSSVRWSTRAQKEHQKLRKLALVSEQHHRLKDSHQRLEEPLSRVHAVRHRGAKQRVRCGGRSLLIAVRL